jgi:RNA polymerase sigma factor (TIGR02999 family)
MEGVTRILEAIRGGDEGAADRLLPLVYDELRRLAAANLAREKPGHTLQATALVHEAYLRLVGEQHFNGRGHFFGAAAEAMRRILVESARRKKRHKHGGGLEREDVALDSIVAPRPDEDVLAIDEALTRLEAAEPRAAAMVRLRYFAGLTVDEAADVLGVSPRTAASAWAYARSWLLADLGGG